MKKILYSIGSLLILAFLVVIVVSASDPEKDPKKSKAAKTETVMPCSASCGNSSAEKAAVCNPAACTPGKDVKCDPATCTAHKDGKCDPATCTCQKDGKCDPATCASHTDNAMQANGNSAAGCPGNCHNAGK